jgi:hypothetical protein
MAGIPDEEVRTPDPCAPTLRRGWRLWMALAGAIIMALAGAMAGQAIGMDELAAPRLNGPRLRVSPVAEVTSGSPSRDSPSTAAIVC